MDSMTWGDIVIRNQGFNIMATLTSSWHRFCDQASPHIRESPPKTPKSWQSMILCFWSYKHATKNNQYHIQPRVGAKQNMDDANFISTVCSSLKHERTSSRHSAFLTLSFITDHVRSFTNFAKEHSPCIGPKWIGSSRRACTIFNSITYSYNGHHPLARDTWWSDFGAYLFVNRCATNTFRPSCPCGLISGDLLMGIIWAPCPCSNISRLSLPPGTTGEHSKIMAWPCHEGLVSGAHCAKHTRKYSRCCTCARTPHCSHWTFQWSYFTSRSGNIGG